tara:strand:+ start:302 stop:541 length:240 start_codon:yes stop_codon:yes gene_type:complete
MQKIQEIIRILKRIISEQDENVLNVRGGRGYSVGHPYPIKSGPQVNQDLGTPGPYEDDEGDEDKNKNKKVKISRAFKKE